MLHTHMQCNGKTTMYQRADQSLEQFVLVQCSKSDQQLEPHAACWHAVLKGCPVGYFCNCCACHYSMPPTEPSPTTARSKYKLQPLDRIIGKPAHLMSGRICSNLGSHWRKDPIHEWHQGHIHGPTGVPSILQNSPPMCTNAHIQSCEQRLKATKPA